MPMRRLTRRATLARLAAAAAAPLAVRGAHAAALEPTPSQTEGPFYPVDKPETATSDLLTGPGGEPAEGEPLALDGRVLDTSGRPLAGALVEIWQCDARGIYRHPRARMERADPNFRGYGESVADARGRYGFLTIVPVPYPGRPPHIHVKVKAHGRATLTTQLYLAEHPENDRDGWLARTLFAGKDRLRIDPEPATLRDGLAGRGASFEFVV